MAILEVVINSKIYQIGCDDKEKEYIKSMINELNEKLEKLKKQNARFFEGITDDKLFLYQLLLVYSEYKELQKKKTIKNIAKAKEESILLPQEETSLNQVITKIQDSVTKINKLLINK
ncbi:cell division protein ZapA [Rickettsiales bacterium LUAb2]